MQSYHFLREWFSTGKNQTYDLDESNVVVELVPIIIEGKKLELVREKNLQH